MVMFALGLHFFDNYVMDSCRNMERIVSDNESVIETLQVESTSLIRKIAKIQEDTPELDTSINRNDKRQIRALEDLVACREKGNRRRVECESFKTRESNIRRSDFIDAAGDDDEPMITEMFNLARKHATRKTEQCQSDLQKMCDDEEKASAEADEDLLATKRKRDDVIRSLKAVEELRTGNLQRLSDARSYVTDSSYKSLQSRCAVSEQIVSFVAKVGSILTNLFDNYEEIKSFIEWGVETFRKVQEL